MKIETELNEQWNIGSGDGGFIAMNIGVSAMFRTVDKIIHYLIKNENIEPPFLKPEELAEKIYPYLNPVINFIKSLDSEGRTKLRRLFGSGATEKVVWEFLHAINIEFINFNPEGLEQWIKDTSGVFNSKSHELGHGKIESLIDTFIKFKLKKEFGEKFWWIEGVPKEIQKKCANSKIEEGSTEPEENFLNTIHYWTIIQKQWKFLGEFFTPPGLENSKKADRISWLQDFNQIRKKYSHPQRENVTEEEYQSLEKIYSWLPQKMEII